MNTIRIFFVLFLLLGIIILIDKMILGSDFKIKPQLFGIQDRTPTPTSAQIPTPSKITEKPQSSTSQNPTPTVFLKPDPTSTPTPTSSKNLLSQSLIYPGAKQVNSQDDTIILQSSDNPKTITDWYKNKIKSMGLSATSFVATSTNGNVLNKLVGGSNGTTVSIEISKKEGDSTTQIKISGDNLSNGLKI